MQCVPLDAENSRLVRELAELCYDIKVTTNDRLLQCMLNGEGDQFAQRADADAFLRTIVRTDKRPYVRVDPTTGEIWVIPVDQVQDYPLAGRNSRLKIR